MAFRLRIFSHFQNAYLLKNFNAFKRTAEKQNCLFYSTSSKTGGTFSKTALVVGGFGIGGGLYGYLAAPDRKKRFENAAMNTKDYTVKTDIPDIEPSRQVLGPAADLDLDLTLYQYQNCPFCCKVRAFLDFYGIPYKVIEVNPVMRQQIKFSSYRKVPILIAKEKSTSVKHQLNDSSVIVSVLGTFLHDANDGLENILKLYVPHIYKDEDGKEVEEVLNRYFIMYGNKAKSDTDENIKKEREWRIWADNELVHLLSPNIYRTYDEALQAFNYFSEAGEYRKYFSAPERLIVIYVGAIAMYLVGKKLKKKHLLKDDVRESLYDACNQWMKAVGSKRKFLGGNLPNLADLAVYGLLSSIEGCLTFQDLLANTNIGTWYYNVKEVIADHAGYQLLNLPSTVHKV